jgi:hypothetical protein
MGWNQGIMVIITKCVNQLGVTLNVVKNYGQTDEYTLNSCCKAFCTPAGINFQWCATQSNNMMVQCLKALLSPAAMVRHGPYQAQYMISNNECIPLTYKHIMCERIFLRGYLFV